MEEEIWKDIPGYEGLYMVSNLGNVKSLNYMHTHKEHLLSPGISKGYLIVVLRNNNKSKNMLVHRLVYQSFNGEIPEGMTVNHIDEDKTNNKLNNLNLLTRAENNVWGTRIERVSKAQLNSIKTSKHVMCVETGIAYPSIKEVERQTGINNRHICGACRGERHTAGGYHWKYIENGEF